MQVTILLLLPHSSLSRSVRPRRSTDQLQHQNMSELHLFHFFTHYCLIEELKSVNLGWRSDLDILHTAEAGAVAPPTCLLFSSSTPQHGIAPAYCTRTQRQWLTQQLSQHGRLLFPSSQQTHKKQKSAQTHSLTDAVHHL